LIARALCPAQPPCCSTILRTGSCPAPLTHLFLDNGQ
jgi:hypothetical protein